MQNILIIGAGGVASALARICAKHNNFFGNITVVSRRLQTARAAADLARPYAKDGSKKITAAETDAKNPDAVAAAIKKYNASIVINAATPYVNLSVMDGCLAAGAHYLDAAVYEVEGALETPPPPWYAEYEWKKRGAFAAANLTGILSIGFAPGVVNVFCAHARENLFDEIAAADIMDINAGTHGRFFATNFDPETNLREIREDAIYWDGGWQRKPPLSQSMRFNFPEIGEKRVFLMGHEELHSLPSYINAPRIVFWMGFSERYLRVFGVLENLGLLSPAPMEIEGAKIAPLKLIKAVLPKPESLAAEYRGKACIGVLARGAKNGKKRATFIYSIISHEAAFADAGAQAVSYSTAAPMATAAMLIMNGKWRANKLVHPEELNPAPFLELMPQFGIDWAVREEPPDIKPEITQHGKNNPPVEL